MLNTNLSLGFVKRFLAFILRFILIHTLIYDLNILYHIPVYRDTGNKVRKKKEREKWKQREKERER